VPKLSADKITDFTVLWFTCSFVRQETHSATRQAAQTQALQSLLLPRQSPDHGNTQTKTLAVENVRFSSSLSSSLTTHIRWTHKLPSKQTVSLYNYVKHTHNTNTHRTAPEIQRHIYYCTIPVRCSQQSSQSIFCSQRTTTIPFIADNVPVTFNRRQLRHRQIRQSFQSIAFCV